MNNTLKKLSSGISDFSSSINHKISNLFSKTKHNIDNIISTKTAAANDDIFDTSTSETIENIHQSTDDILQKQTHINKKILCDFTGKKILRLKNQEYKLIFENWEIKKALKNVKWKYIHLNAKAIRQLSQILQKKSTEVNRISYNTKRNVERHQKTWKKKHDDFDSLKYKNKLKQEVEQLEIEQEQINIQKENQRIKKEKNWSLAQENIFKTYSHLEYSSDEITVSDAAKIIAELQKYIIKKSTNDDNIIQLHPAARNFENIVKLIKNISTFLTLDGTENQDSLHNHKKLVNIFTKASRSMFKHYKNLAKKEQETIENRKFDWVVIENWEDFPNERAHSEEKFWKAYESKKRA